MRLLLLLYPPPSFQFLTLPLVTLILLFSFYQDDTTDVVAPDSGRLVAGISVDDVSSGLFRKRFQSLNPVRKAIVLRGFHVWLVALDLMHRQVRQSKTTATMMVSFGKAIGDVSGYVGYVKESSGVLKVNAMERSYQV